MKLKIVFASVIVLAFSLSQVINAQAQKKAEPWPVPATDKAKANPVACDDATMKIGMASWTKNCASCHGKTGLGDGPKGRMCKTNPGNFSATDFQASTDGELFFRTKTGRNEMPSFDKKIPDNEIWALVNHMRSFKQ
jgi:mono/diheme cytochrome c family protein